LFDVVHASTFGQSTRSIDEQFVDFIVKPSQHITTLGPLVWVISGLDGMAGGSLAEREEILSVVATKFNRLPSNIRTLVTSEIQPNIYDSFANEKSISTRFACDFDDAVVYGSLAGYIGGRLDEYAASYRVPMLRDWRRHESLLSETSRRSLDWCRAMAVLLCDLAQSAQAKSSLPHLEALLATSDIDHLYTEATTAFLLLYSKTKNRGEESGWNIIQRMMPAEVDIRDASKAVLHILSSLHTVSNEMHDDFIDFLRSPVRRKNADLGLDDSALEPARCCLRVLEDDLKPNLCGFDLKYLERLDDGEVRERMKSAALAPLRYACERWMVHVRSAGLDKAGIYPRQLPRIDWINWLEALYLMGICDVLPAGIDTITEFKDEQVR
jgi:hypothetical protein